MTTAAPVVRRRRSGPNLMRWAAWLCVAALLAAAAWAALANGPAPAPAPASWGDLPGPARAAVSQAIGRDQARFHATRVSGGFALRNAASGVSASFGRHGARLGAGDASIGLALRGAGRGTALQALPGVAPRASANRIVYAHPGLSEWYANGPAGLEHGFTVTRRPAGAHDGDLTLGLDLAGATTARVDGDGHGATLRRGTASLRYTGLWATDATGRDLPARLHSAGGALRVAVDDRDAQYPITIDPFVQTAKLTSSDGRGGDGVGSAVAISGDTIAVGAPNADIGANADQGAVYVFRRSGANWGGATQVAKLTGADGGANDQLGISVAIDGDTIVAGASHKNVGASMDQGMVYVFVRPAGGWADATQTAELTTSTASAIDELGGAVAISGDTIVTGSSSHHVAFNSVQGQAYVYVRPAGGWADATQTATLTASDNLHAGGFGKGIAVAGDTVVVGNTNDQGARGAAYVFVRPATGWADAAQAAKLTASDAATNDRLGNSLAISGDTIVAGSIFDDPGASADQGSAYVFVRPAGGWADTTQTAKLTAANGAAGEFFGASVAIDGTTIVAGAPDTSRTGSFQGSAYLFVRPAAGWADATQTTELLAADGTQNSLLGTSVATDGDNVVAGALQAGPGAAYVFGPDLDAPQTTITGGPSPTTDDATSTFDFTASEPSTFECRVDSGAFTPCTSPYTTAPLADGQHTFEVRAIDRSANIDTTPDSRTFTVDTTAPDTTITSGPTGLTPLASPPFTFISSETGSTFECRVDSAAFSSCSSPFAPAPLADGPHTFEVRATDAAGNTDAAPDSRTFTVDATRPDTTITGGPDDSTNGATNDATPTFTFTSSETGSTFGCRIDGAAGFAPCTSPYTTPALADGRHVLEVIATDPTGNFDVTPADVVFFVDTAAPDTQILSGPDGVTNDATPTFTFDASESGATFACRLDDGAYAACDTPDTLASLANGPHTLSVRATDLAGNVDPTPVTRAFTVDTAGPDTMVTGGPSGLTGDDTPTFTFASPEAGTTFECRLATGNFSPCTSPYTSAHLADGDWTFEVRAVDAAGNTDATPATRAFTVDATAPDTFLSGAGGVLTTTTPTFTFSASEGDSTFECRVDAGAYGPCTSPHTTEALGQGQHTFEVRATDAAGNTDPTPAIGTFTIDSQAPDTTITDGPSELTGDRRPAFSFDSPDATATFECRVDDGAFATCDSPHVTAILADGEHTFQVRATDAAGNTDATPASRTFTVDTVAPQTTITSGPPAASTNATPTFGFTSSQAGSTFECRVDAGTFAACTSPRTTAALSGGAHTFAVRATDPANNTDPTPATRSFRVCSGLLGGLGVLLDGLFPGSGLLCS